MRKRCGTPKRHMKVSWAAALMLLLCATPCLHAQEADDRGDDLEERFVVITYMSGTVEVDRTPDNQLSDFEPAEEGMKLQRGAILRTGKGSLCELSLPEGSLFRVSKASVFQIDQFLYADESGEKRGKFSLVFGRVFSRIQKLLTPQSRMEITSGTTLAGVRGTEIAIGFDGEEAQVFVFEGSVEVQSTTGAFEPIQLEQGQMSVIGAKETGPARRISRRMVRDWEEEMDMEIEVSRAETMPEEVTAKAEPGEPVEPAEPEGLFEVPGEEESLRQPVEREGGFFLTGTAGILTFGSDLYTRFSLIPGYRGNNFSAALSLPVIADPGEGFFRPGDWQNSDEWDFKGGRDLLHDLLIKVDHVYWGDTESNSSIRVGRLDGVRLGHGFIVDRYSNRLHEPEELSTGATIALGTDTLGFEGLSGDLSRFELLGGRFHGRPFGPSLPLVFGATVVHDRPHPDESVWPLGPAAEPTTEEDQLPRIYLFGGDVEMGLSAGDKLRLVVYGDFAKEAYTYPALQPSLQGTGFADEGSLEFLKGAGTAAGVAGNVADSFRFRFEYRMIFDYFEPGLIGPFWENRRLTYPQELLLLIHAQNSSLYDGGTTTGILLDGGFSLLRALDLDLGYETYKSSGDRLHAGYLRVALPRESSKRLYGDLIYDRGAGLESIFDEPFDANTRLRANVYLGVTNSLSVGLHVYRSFLFDEHTSSFEPVKSYGIDANYTF
jgi:hypothetical protein